MRTYLAKPDQRERKWYVVDAKGQTLGRLASVVAGILRETPSDYTPMLTVAIM